LKKAWEDLGYPASNPSLNNCISELRKSFELLGLDKKLIVTIPRIGFKVEANIQPCLSNEHTNMEGNTFDNVGMLTTDDDLIKDKKKLIPLAKPIRKHIFKKINVVYYLLSLSILAIIYLLFSRVPEPVPKESSPQLIGTYKNCTIFTLHRMPPSSNLMIKATKMLETENVGCEHGKQDVFYYEDKVSNGPMKVTFFASCKKNDSGKNKFCIKYKTIE